MPQGTEEMDDKEQLKVNIKKKIDTTMIFPLSQFEGFFGHLWGHGKLDNELSGEEKVFREKWIQCRRNILDNGNRQKDNCSTEIETYEVSYKG